MTYDVEIDPDAEYTFEVAQSTIPDYRMCSAISQWIKENMQSLADDNDNVIFGKVNVGYNENTLKTLGKKPVCDIHINNVDYNNDLQLNYPERVNTIILFYFKGANEYAYEKACELHDYVMQEFIENEEFKRLDNYVKDTVITNSEIMNNPSSKRWGVMGAIELSHILYI